MMLLVAAALVTLTSQDVDAEPLAKKLDVDVSIPTNPGLAIVGADPSGLTQISAFSDLGAQLGNYMDESGRVQPGFAFGVRPYWLGRNRITLEEYAGRDALTRIAARTQLSFAGVGDGDDGVRLGVGFHTQLLDGQDPRYLDAASPAAQNLGACLDRLNRVANLARLRTDNPAAFAALPEAQRTAALAFNPSQEDACYADARKAFLDQQGWVIGAGLALAGEDGFDGLEEDGLSVWTAYRHPLGSGPGDLTARLVYRSDAEFEVTGGVLNASEASAALVYGEERDGRRWELVADYTIRDYDTPAAVGVVAPDEDGFFSVGARYLTRIREGLWLEFGYVSVPDGGVEQDDRVTVQVKFDLD